MQVFDESHELMKTIYKKEKSLRKMQLKEWNNNKNAD